MGEYGVEKLKQEHRKWVEMCANCHAEEYSNEGRNNTRLNVHYIV